ncbi:MAG: CHRD domain-containing protein [Puniceicoccaceae bacterium]|nr:MAG: CHRD domain-containing protein [Puniceicoccaceae bacterium]
MRSKLRAIVLSFVGLVASTAVLSATTVVFEFTLSGDQEVPVVVTPATGNATVTLDIETNYLTWDVSYTGLLGNLTMAHFHGPAAEGVNAGVIINMNPDLGMTSGTIIGSATISDENKGYIIDGLAYINLHSTVHGGGELRGQVIPEPATYALLAGLAALAGVLFLRRRRA